MYNQNMGNIFPMMFDNRSVNSNIKANYTTFKLLNTNSQCCVANIVRQHKMCGVLLIIKFWIPYLNCEYYQKINNFGSIYYLYNILRYNKLNTHQNCILLF